MEVVVDTQKIENLFIVQLQKGDTDAPFRRIRHPQVVKKGIEGPWDHASVWILVNRDIVIRFAFHSVSLSGSRLTVSKDRAVVALHDLVDERSHHSLVHIGLVGLGSEDAVKGESLGQRGIDFLLDFHLAVARCGHYWVGPMLLNFRFIEGPEKLKVVRW